MAKDNKRTLGFVIVSNDNDGLRHDTWSGETYIERLDISGARTDRLNTFFKDHNRSVDSACGRVHDIRSENGQLKANVTIGSDSDSILTKYREGILTDVSIGYAIRDFVIEEREGQPDIVTVTDFEIFELSCVGIGFDRSAKIERQTEEVSEVDIAKISEQVDLLEKSFREKEQLQKTELKELNELIDLLEKEIQQRGERGNY